MLLILIERVFIQIDTKLNVIDNVNRSIVYRENIRSLSLNTRVYVYNGDTLSIYISKTSLID